MIPLFADTFFYLTIMNPDDQAHERTAALARRITGPVVTTAWVLTEVGDAMSAPARRPIFLALLNALRADAEMEIVPPISHCSSAGSTCSRDVRTRSGA